MERRIIKTKNYIDPDKISSKNKYPDCNNLI